LSDFIYTLGHSTHAFERVLSLLRQHGITAVGDVRSQPYSRVNPQFNREPFQKALQQCGLSYVFLGAELGGRTEDPSCYINGRVRYDLLAQTSIFKSGIGRLERGMSKYRIAILCAEKEPLACHRALLIGRHLRERGIGVRHILENGILEDHDSSVERLLRVLRLPEEDIFRSRAEIISLAYTLQADKIAYTSDDKTMSA
jgi:uncharacterized protein (DUF488 family)